MLGLGGGEIVVIVVIAVVLFGKEDLPRTLKKMSKGYNEFKKVASDAQRSWSEVRDDVTRTIMAIPDEEPSTPPHVTPSVEAASIHPHEAVAAEPELTSAQAIVVPTVQPSPELVPFSKGDFNEKPPEGAPPVADHTQSHSSEEESQKHLKPLG